MDVDDSCTHSGVTNASKPFSEIESLPPSFLTSTRCSALSFNPVAKNNVVFGTVNDDCAESVVVTPSSVTE